MIKIDNDTRLLKHNALKRVCELAFQGKLSEETVQEIPFEQIPGMQPHFRCCVYKEREIIHQRVRLAMGKMPNGKKPTSAAVTVIPAACEGCPIQRYTVTENCQKCVAKKCMQACPFGAISMSGRGAYIDPGKCRECGRCAAACPYSAIADLVRPCRKACPVGAIEIGEDKLADIDEEKCISCGACMQACPFAAISDRAQVVPIIADMRAGKQLIAMLAPALEGQFGANVTMGKLKKAVEALGFLKVYEVGLGADAVAMAEAQELLEHLDAGLKMTTSCCPAFVNMIRKHFPRLLPNVSTTVSPMVALSRWAREKYPQAKIVFVGPCVAKKTEEVEGGPDYVMTTEELVAMLEAKGVDPERMEDDVQDASLYGKGFASSGGVTGAVMQAIQEMEGETPQVSAQRCNGAAECKKALTLLGAGKFDLDFIEGMACEGGCMYGPGNLLSERLYTQARKKLLAAADDRGVVENAKEQGFDHIHMHR
jgi:ferredoxin hydrogenase large subunit